MRSKRIISFGAISLSIFLMLSVLGGGFFAVYKKENQIMGNTVSQTLFAADKTALQDAINAAGLILPNQALYEPGSFNVFFEKYTEAVELNTNPDALQNNIDSRKNALLLAISQLEFKKDDLRNALQQAQGQTPEGYTSESWQLFSEAVLNGETILSKVNASQTEIAVAANNIRQAILGLNLNVQALRDLIALATNKIEFEYTRESYAALLQAVAAANGYINKNSFEKTELINETNKMQAAVNALISNGGVPEKQVLLARIKEYEALSYRHYTTASFAALQAVLEQANSLFNLPTALAEEVSAKTAQLIAAKNSLVVYYPVTNKQALEEAIAYYEEYEEENYTPASWAGFNQALISANWYKTDVYTTEAEAEDAITALQTNFALLELNIGLLNSIIVSAKQKTESYYTIESFALLNQSIDVVEAAILAGITNLQDFVALKENIRQALTALVSNGGEFTNKENLLATIKENNLVVQGVYSLASWQAFTQALEAATLVYNNATATYSEVALAITNLSEKKELLTEDTGETPNNYTWVWIVTVSILGGSLLIGGGVVLGYYIYSKNRKKTWEEMQNESKN